MADTEAPPTPVEDVEPEAPAPIPLQYQGTFGFLIFVLSRKPRLSRIFKKP